MSPRPDVREERCSQILAAAIAVFARSGFRASRMEDIATEAKLSKGSLYLYFDSKDAIVMRLMEEIFSRQLNDVRAVLGPAGSAERGLDALVQRIAEDVRRMAEVLPIAWEFYAIAARDERARTFFRGYFAEYRQLLARFLDERIARGEIGPSADANALSVAIIGLLEGLTLLWITDPAAVRWEEQVTASIRMLLRGVTDVAPPRTKSRTRRTGHVSSS
jgi:TetR/AcrR family fatty acid metabolism transcriptional regulator